MPESIEYKIVCFAYSELGTVRSYPDRVSYGDSILCFIRDYRPMVGDIFVYSQTDSILGVLGIADDSKPFEGFVVDKVISVTGTIFHCYGRTVESIPDMQTSHIDELGLYVGHTEEQVRAFPDRFNS